MNYALWGLQGLLALAMVGAGAMKAFTPRQKLAEKMKWVASWTDLNVKLLGLAELLGAIGLIAPGALGFAPFLTPLAATCLAVLMVGAIKTHLDLKEPIVAPAVLTVIAIAIVVGRVLFVPLGQ